MLKYFLICAALVALGTNSLSAQEREAILQRVAVPGASFDMVVAMPKSSAAAIYDLGDTPDALVIHLIGGELWIGFEDAGKMLRALDALKRPIGAFHAESDDGTSPKPVAVYVIPKSDTSASPDR